MAYFNHAFHKQFLCTGPVAPAGVKTVDLVYTNQTGARFGFFNAKTWTALDPATDFTVSGDCCPIVLASASFLKEDKIGPFHGGYKESNKSKVINPKYVSAIYEVPPCPAQNAQVIVGETAVNVDEAGCAKNFKCGETYYLRLDLKGSPILQHLSRNSYWNADAYGGCCAEDAEGATVDPLVIYSQWAYHFMNNDLLSPFINIQLTYSVDNGANWLELTSGANLETWRTYADNQIAGVTNAGMIINGAYVDTRFGDCTFYPSDSTIAFMEPVRIYASEVDLNGDPCEFAGICTQDVCQPIQLSGTGEHVIKDLILSESYRQNVFATNKDLRIREITQGYDFTDAVDRTASYHRIFIVHNVPRFNNPSGVFDNEQYLLELIFPAGAATIPTAKTFLKNWLECANNCLEFPTIACPAVCDPVLPVVEAPEEPGGGG